MNGCKIRNPKSEIRRNSQWGNPKRFQSVLVSFDIRSSFGFGISDLELPPRGWTLIETVVAHGMLAVVMTVSAALFLALARSERNAWSSCAVQQTLSRLQEQFRLDVHRSDAAKLDGDNRTATTLTLSDADGEVARYAVERHRLERLAKVSGGEHRETWRIPEAEWSFAVSEASPRTVTLSLQRPAGSVTQSPKEFLPIKTTELKAVLNLRRLATDEPGDAP